MVLYSGTVVLPGGTIQYYSIVLPGSTVVLPGGTIQWYSIVLPGGTLVLPGGIIVLLSSTIEPPLDSDNFITSSFPQIRQT